MFVNVGTHTHTHTHTHTQRGRERREKWNVTHSLNFEISNLTIYAPKHWIKSYSSSRRKSISNEPVPSIPRLYGLLNPPKSSDKL